MSYNDNTIMSRGKYKAWKLKDVPATFLVRIHDNGGGNDPELKAYIAANIERLRLKAIGFEAPPIEHVPFICEKKTFATKKDAQNSLKTIRSTKTEKKPIRAYECPKCSGWHLTSMPIEVFKSLQE